MPVQRLIQEGKSRLEVTAVYGDLSESVGVKKHNLQAASQYSARSTVR